MTPLMPTLIKGSNVYWPPQGTYGAASATLPLTKDTDHNDPPAPCDSAPGMGCDDRHADSSGAGFKG